MATINITIDTEAETLAVAVNGKTVEGDVTDIYVNRYPSWNKPNEYCLCWSVNVSNSTGDDDVSSRTVYTSASTKHDTLSKASADISNFLDKRRRGR